MINKFQLGGLASLEEQVVMQFVLALALVLQTEPELVVAYALKNPKALEQAFQVFQLTQDIKLAALIFASSAQKAKHGAKLNYIKALKNMCGEDEELVRFANGGCLCLKKKMLTGGEVNKKDPVSKFKERKSDNIDKTTTPVKKPIKKPIFYNNSEWSISDDLKLLLERRKGIKNGPYQKKFNSLSETNKKKYELSEEKCGGKMKKKANGGKAPYDVDVLAPLKSKKK